MKLRTFVLQTATLLLFSASVTAQSGNSVELDNDSNFLMRAFQKSIVVGKYLYIDGGEVSFRPSGSQGHTVRTSMSI